MIVIAGTYCSKFGSSTGPATLEAMYNTSPLGTDARRRFVADIADELPETLRSSVDPSVDPCQDFFKYSCGSWIASTQNGASLNEDHIYFLSPSHKVRGAISLEESQIEHADEKSWDQAQNAVNQEMKQLIEAHYPADSPFKPVQDWYNSCMNASGIDEKGISGINETLALIDSIETTQDVNRAVAHFIVWRISAFMSLRVRKDPRSAFSMNMLNIDFGGRTLQNINDYIQPRHAWKLKRLRKYLADIFTLAGYGEGADDAAAAAVEMEQRLAHWVISQALLYSSILFVVPLSRISPRSLALVLVYSQPA
jgi:putative endopeptidase